MESGDMSEVQSNDTPVKSKRRWGRLLVIAIGAIATLGANYYFTLDSLSVAPQS
jgi:hypothetical protein